MSQGQGSGKGSYKTKDGAEASGGLKLKGNVKCEIGDPAGNPPRGPRLPYLMREAAGVTAYFLGVYR